MKSGINLFPAAIILSLVIHAGIFIADSFFGTNHSEAEKSFLVQKIIPGVSALSVPPVGSRKPDPDSISRQEDNTAESVAGQKPQEFTNSANDIVITETEPFVSGTSAENNDQGDAGQISQQDLYLNYNFSAIQQSIAKSLVYPARARRAGMYGIVEIIFAINTDGTVSDAAVQTSSGYEILDNAAIRAVQTASPFPKPPERMKIAVPINFELKQ